MGLGWRPRPSRQRPTTTGRLPFEVKDEQFPDGRRPTRPARAAVLVSSRNDLDLLPPGAQDACAHHSVCCAVLPPHLGIGDEPSLASRRVRPAAAPAPRGSSVRSAAPASYRSYVPRDRERTNEAVVAAVGPRRAPVRNPAAFARKLWRVV